MASVKLSNRGARVRTHRAAVSVGHATLNRRLCNGTGFALLSSDHQGPLEAAAGAAPRGRDGDV